MTNKLKPCPFCGSEPYIRGEEYLRTLYYGVKCRCGAETAAKATEAEAVEAWNKRAAYEAEGYFFLPKPKERLFYTVPLGIEETESGYRAQTGFQILEDAAKRWADEIDDEILRRIIGCWNTRAERTCFNASTRKDETQFTCSACWLPVFISTVNYMKVFPNYCPHCGARVVEYDKDQRR